MKPIWRQKWQNLARKRAQSGLYARSSAVTLRGNAILPSFGFGRFDHLHRRETLENAPHFLRFRSSQLVKTIQTKLTSFMSPYPSEIACFAKNGASQVRPLPGDPAGTFVRRPGPGPGPPASRIQVPDQVRDGAGCGAILTNRRNWPNSRRPGFPLPPGEG